MIITIPGQKYHYKMVIEPKKITLQIADQTFTAEYNFLTKQTGYLTNVPNSFYDLMLYVLLQKLDIIPLPSPWNTDKKSEKVIVSYSGGADSTATLHVTDGIPVHITRSFDLQYENRQIRACNYVNALNIVTDFENIRKMFGLRHGFSTGIGYSAMYIPLLNLFQINTIALGVIFDDLAFYYGNPFAFNLDFSHSVIQITRHILQRYNIHIILPIAGYSEILALRLANESGIPYSSCHTLGDDQVCGACYKCFRKQAIQGKPIDLNDETTRTRIFNVLKKQPLKMASSTIYAIQKAGYKIPQFARYMDIDVTFCDRVNPDYVTLFGGKLLPGYEYQNASDMEKINRFITAVNDPELYENI